MIPTTTVDVVTRSNCVRGGGGRRARGANLCDIASFEIEN